MQIAVGQTEEGSPPGLNSADQAPSSQGSDANGGGDAAAVGQAATEEVYSASAAVVEDAADAFAGGKQQEAEEEEDAAPLAAAAAEAAGASSLDGDGAASAVSAVPDYREIELKWMGAEDRLYRRVSRRDVAAAVGELQQLAALLDELLPPKPPVTRKLFTPPPPAPEAPPAAAASDSSDADAAAAPQSSDGPAAASLEAPSEAGDESSGSSAVPAGEAAGSSAPHQHDGASASNAGVEQVQAAEQQQQQHAVVNDASQHGAEAPPGGGVGAAADAAAAAAANLAAPDVQGGTLSADQPFADTGGAQAAEEAQPQRQEEAGADDATVAAVARALTEGGNVTVGRNTTLVLTGDDLRRAAEQAQQAKSRRYKLAAAGRAMYTLAVLEASGLVKLPPPAAVAENEEEDQRDQLGGAAAAPAAVASGDGGGGSLLPGRFGRLPFILSLHRAAEAGNQEATLALADRFFSGRGVQASCPVGLSYALQAAAAVAAEVEAEVRYTVVSPPELRERWADANVAAMPEDPDNAPEVVAMDEDLALRGNADAQRRMAYRCATACLAGAASISAKYTHDLTCVAIGLPHSAPLLRSCCHAQLNAALSDALSVHIISVCGMRASSASVSPR